MNKFLLQIDYLSESFLLFLKKRMMAVLFFLLVVFVMLFVVLFFLEKKQEKKQEMLGLYVKSQSYVFYNETQKALRGFQEVYGNSSGALELLAWSSIIDLLVEDKQYDAVLNLIKDVPTLEQKGDFILIFVAKSVSVLNKIAKNLKVSEIQEARKLLLSLVQGAMPSKQMLSHQMFLIKELGGKVDLKNLPENQLSQILKIIDDNQAKIG